MTNRTQCPECFTVFMITDEQLVRSKGKVRCGRCRSTFNAQLMSVEDAADLKRQQLRRSNTSQSTNQNELDDPEAIESDNGSRHLQDPETSADQDNIEPSRDREYTASEDISNHIQVSYRNDMLGSFSESRIDDAAEAPSLNKRSDRLFSEAMEAIDNTPSFKLDDYTGSGTIEEELGIAPPETRPVDAYEEPSAIDQQPSAIDQQPPESESDSSVIMRSHSGEQDLADALSVIDATPSFDIEDYRESMLDEPEALENSVDTIDPLLPEAFAVIDEIPNFSVEDNKESTLDDMELSDRQSRYDIVSGERISLPARALIKTADDTHLAEAITVIEKSPSFQMADYTSGEDRLFGVEIQNSNQFSEPSSDQPGELDRPFEETETQEVDQSLISEVDQLIEEKLVIGSIEMDQSDTVNFNTTTKYSALNRWVYGPLLGLMALLMVAGVNYQLWLKQAAPILESPQLATTLEPITKQLKQQLQRLDLILPERRNLNQLELLSARTEAHPNRSSTILLRASLINRAKISQPFPWLELSLTDEDGRLISRRALAPNDYLHNNRLDNIINANELKQVTIELLAFPKQAHGFELRLLNK